MRNVSTSTHMLLHTNICMKLRKKKPESPDIKLPATHCHNGNLKKKDQRRYKLPTHGEVAAVVVGDDGIPPIVLSLIVYPRDIANHGPLSYPIPFPHGERGWSATFNTTCNSKKEYNNLSPVLFISLAFRE